MNSEVQNLTNSTVFLLPQILYQKQEYFVQNGQKIMFVWVMIGVFRSIFSVSVFKGQMLVAIIMVDNSVKHKPYSVFERQCQVVQSVIKLTQD